MDLLHERIERALRAFFDGLRHDAGPHTLAAALEHAVFPGGARVRPKLCLAAAVALGDPEPSLADAACVALELVHCASLAHDDLPCFDDAATRRGRPSVHAAFGVPTAVLVGDALIALAFEVLAHANTTDARRVVALVRELAVAIGYPHGAIAGQAWEAELDRSPAVLEGAQARAALAVYHRAKTARLFEAALSMGAICGGRPPEDFARVGLLLGSAYQIADDVADQRGSSEAMGKPTGIDEALGRPSAVKLYGAAQCLRLVEQLLNDAAAAVPDCAGRAGLVDALSSASSGVFRFLQERSDRSEEPTRRTVLDRGGFAAQTRENLVGGQEA